MSRPHHPAWWHEFALIAVIYGTYTLTRNTLPAHIARAHANAAEIYRVERHLHLDAEPGLNHVLASHSPHWLAVVANYIYSLSHFGVTVAVLGWLYLARPRVYVRARTVLLLTTLLGLLGFWLYPLAPPRMLPQLGFVDTVVRDHTWGSWGTTAVPRMSNQYAAMPSVHVAWSVWVAATVTRYTRGRRPHLVACTYPVLVFLVIVGTANHWTLDAAGGVAAVGVAESLCGASRLGRRRRARRRERQRAPDLAAGACG